MAISTRLLKVSLYVEHLQEASFLYEQRQAYLHDAEVPWPSLDAWEQRFEAHLDGLVLGDDLASAICLERIAEGDPGELHTVLRLCCRRDMKREAFDIITGLDPGNVGAVRAATTALTAELPARWRDDLLGEFARHASLTPLLATVIGYRRIPAEAALVQRITQGLLDGAAEVAWALGRIGTANCLPALAGLATSNDDRVREHAIIAMLRHGDPRMLQSATALAGEHAWAQRVLGVAGGSQAPDILLSAVQAGRGGCDAVLALGLLGDLAAVVPLVALLADDVLGDTAAVALNTITGAQLRGRVFVPYQLDPDELDDEGHAASGGNDTRHASAGEWVQGPLRDKAGWQEWLERNRSRFHRNARWRMGAPHGPAALVTCLRAETTPFAVRAAAYDELVIRHGLDMPFEVDLPVRTLHRLLDRLTAWSAASAVTGVS